MRPQANCRRGFLLVGFTIVLMLVTMAGLAWGVGELTQKLGMVGCAGGQPADGCAEGRGLDDVVAVAVSPDGRNVYSASALGNSIAIFDRDPATGALAQKRGLAGCISMSGGAGCESGRALREPLDIVVSPDGTSVYVASFVSGAVAIFHRDAAGNLTQAPGTAGCVARAAAENCQPGRALKGAWGLTVSPDGSSVYLAARESDGVAIFDRAPSGALTQKLGVNGCVASEGDDNDGNACLLGRALGSPLDVVVSQDGKSAYAVANTSGTVSIFDREPDGALRQKPGEFGCIAPPGSMEGCKAGRNLDGIEAVAISPDGTSVYVGGAHGADMTVFDRLADGSLREKPGADGCLGGDVGCAAARGLFPEHLAVSPDGATVYGAGGIGASTDAVLRRAPDGRLSQLPGTAGCIAQLAAEGCETAKTLAGAEGVAVSPDGKNVYVASRESDAIAIFSRATPPPAEERPDRTPPTVSRFKLSPSRFMTGRGGRGSRVRFSLSEPARVEIAIDRARPSRRFRRFGALSYRHRAGGRNSIAFRGVVNKRRLVPGSYRATIVARDAAGNASAPRRARFTVLAPRSRSARH